MIFILISENKNHKLIVEMCHLYFYTLSLTTCILISISNLEKCFKKDTKFIFTQTPLIMYILHQYMYLKEMVKSSDFITVNND